MKLILTSVIAIIFVALGSLAGVMLKPTVEVAASTPSEAGEGDYAADTAADKKDAKKKSDGYDSGSSGDSVYYKFSREFVVPIMRSGQVESLVILHISLETDESTSDDLFSEEPNIRRG